MAFQARPASPVGVQPDSSMSHDREVNYSDSSNWDLYLPAALFTYLLSKHWVTRFSLFAILYRRDATIPSLLGMQLSISDTASNSEDHIKVLVNCIIDIQAYVYVSAYKTKDLELIPSNAGCAPLPEFQVGEMVLYNQHQLRESAHILDCLWIGPLKLTFKRGVEYIVKLLFTGHPFS
ncbi:hypothetical protein DSO57_1005225 [Entomophthora muscae]|uniref:Uncharacterized protein n=1 Tax=Entomophthora muscae TaxID=34485 RepID=A0ACC2U5R7_9FUNG|nr:hypothetical protein DSO57_1005225 [Entomophthora muscae]